MDVRRSGAMTGVVIAAGCHIRYHALSLDIAMIGNSVFRDFGYKVHPGRSSNNLFDSLVSL